VAQESILYQFISAVQIGCCICYCCCSAEFRHCSPKEEDAESSKADSSISTISSVVVDGAVVHRQLQQQQAMMWLRQAT
jgi:hypothetical protein